MAKVKQHKVISRLSTTAFKRGGISAAQALKAAEATLDALRPPCLEDLDAALDVLDKRFGRDSVGSCKGSNSDVYLLGSKIIDSAIGLPGSGVDQAARALCEFVDQAEQWCVQDWAVVGIHVDCLKLLRATGATMSSVQLNAVLEGLAQLARKRLSEVAVTAP